MTSSSGGVGGSFQKMIEADQGEGGFEIGPKKADVNYEWSLISVLHFPNNKNISLDYHIVFQAFPQDTYIWVIMFKSIL